MDYIWLITAWAVIFALYGLALAGCIIPLLPGHPLVVVATLIARFALPGVAIAWYNWVLLALICIIGMFGDNLFSLWGAKHFGSTRAGLWGCLIGIMAGLLFPPWGLILGPFAGALAAELIVSRQTLALSLRSGFGAFAGTIAGFIFKLAIAVMMIGYSLILILGN